MPHLPNLRRFAGRHQGLWPWLVALALSAVIVGCGGGTSTASNGVGVGGTGAAATGPVSGYGSIIVNSVRFDFSGASFTTEDADDGGDQSDETLPTAATLRAADRPVEFGTVVSVDAGSISNDGTYDLANASKIMLISAIRGPIQAINGNTLTVLGQTVEVDAGTWYVTGHELANLAVNQNVVVYGDYSAATGHYKATRVEYRANLVTYKVRGPIGNLSGNTFSIGGITVNYGSARLPGNQPLANGQMVRVRMLRTTVGGNYVALVVAPTAASLSNGQQTRLAGVASDVNTSTKHLEINEVEVNYSQVNLNNLVQPTDGARIEVEGTIQNGVLVATKLTVKSEVEAELSKVHLIDRVKDFTDLSGAGTKARGSFTMKGLTITYDAVSTPAVLDGGLTAAQMANNLMLDVEGNRSTSDQSVIVATRIRLAPSTSH